MPVSISGLESGMDTDAIIEKLVTVEARPIRQLELSKQRHNKRINALRKLQENLEEVNKSARELYGFRAAYDYKGASSSNSEALEVKASKLAEKGVKQVKILQIAKAHKIATDPVSVEKDIPSGKFTLEVDGEPYVISFKGGRLKSLRDKIDEVASDVVTTSYTNIEGDRYVLSLQSKVTGKKGEIKLKGKRDFLKEIGLVKGLKDEARDTVNLTFDRRYFSPYEGDKKVGKQTGSLQVGSDGKSVTVEGLLWEEYTLPAGVTVKKDSVLEFDFTYDDGREEEEDARVPFRVELGPEERTVIKGIELKGYNVSRLRKKKEPKKEEQYDTILGIGVVAEIEGRRQEKIYPVPEDARGRQEIPIGKNFEGSKVTGVILYTNRGKTDFSNASILTPIKEKGTLEPKNIIADAQDARLKVDGLEIVRDKNTDLNDVIKGLTLTIKRPYEREIDITVTHDLEASIDKIKKFVDAYNAYLDLHRQLIKSGKPRNVSLTRTRDRDREMGNKGSGLFVGDVTIMRLESSLRRIINSAYPNRADEQIKILTQLGVSTGDINASWETIKEGKLIVDESKLRQTIRDNPDGVRMFFGSDTDGDNRTDTGMAYTLVSNLKPYIMPGKSIIKSKIDLEDNSIELANERIDRHEQHIREYRSRLKEKFTRMEQTLSRTKSQKQWFNAQMGNSKKKDK